MKKIALTTLAIVGMLSGIAQTVSLEKGDKGIEYETASPKKWYKNPTKKIVVLGVRLEFDSYAGKASSGGGALMTVNLNGLNQELLNEIGNQFYEDFKRGHEALGFTVNTIDVDRVKSNKKFASFEKKGKARIIQGEMVDVSDDKKAQNRSVFIYPDKVPYIYIDSKGGGGRDGGPYSFSYFNSTAQIIQRGEIGALICIKVNFYDFLFSNGGVKGRPSLYLTSSPDEGCHPYDCQTMYFTFTEKGKMMAQGQVVVSKGKMAVEETDFVELITDEKDGNSAVNLRDMEYQIVEDKFKAYTTELLADFGRRAAELFNAHLIKANE